MSTFDVKAYEVTIEPHNNADALEVAIIGDYRSVVRVGQFKTGDTVVYIPESAVLPHWLIEELGLVGKLAGSQHNRVKAVKLRGVLSQGLLVPYTITDHEECVTVIGNKSPAIIAVDPNFDFANVLGITKYVPPIPTQLQGKVKPNFGYTVSYDIENIKKHPTALIDGEDVVMTEKLHGTWTCWGWHTDVGNVITSKGHSNAGRSFEETDDNYEQNAYMRQLINTTDQNMETAIDRAKSLLCNAVGVYLIGELFGGNIQDLKYGMKDPSFRLFDVFIGTPVPGGGYYLDFDMLEALAAEINIDVVPVLYRGPFSKDVMLLHTSGSETINGAHMREGIVVKPTTERYRSDIGRVNMKSVSEQYLLRKNASEHN